MRGPTAGAIGSRAGFTLDARGHRVPLGVRARRLRTAVRFVVVAEIAFLVQLVWDATFVYQSGTAVLRIAVFGLLLVVCDVGVWDLERPALKARLVLAGACGVLVIVALIAMLSKEHGLEEYLEAAPRYLHLEVGCFAGLCAAWSVVCPIALRVTRRSR